MQLKNTKRRLNRMGDEGCKVVCDSIRNSQNIGRFNFSANSAGVPGYVLNDVVCEWLGLLCISWQLAYEGALTPASLYSAEFKIGV